MVCFSYTNNKVGYELTEGEKKYIKYINKEVDVINHNILRLLKLNELWTNCNNRSIKDGLLYSIIDCIGILEIYFIVKLNKEGLMLLSKDINIKKLIEK